MKDSEEWAMSIKEMIKDLFKKEEEEESYKPKKISRFQMWRLKKEFPMSKTEREKMRILKKERIENIKAYLVIVNLFILAVILIYVLYLMWTYKW